MKLNASKSTVVLPLGDISTIQDCLEDIERVMQKAYSHKTALTDEEIVLNRTAEIREALSLTGGFKKLPRK